MRASRLTRIVAGTAISTIIAVGLVAPSALASTAPGGTTRVVSGHVFLGDASRSAGAGEVTVTARTTGEHPVTASTKTDAGGDYSLAVTTADASVRATLSFTYTGSAGYRDGQYPNLATTGPAHTLALTANDRPGTDITLARPLPASTSVFHPSAGTRSAGKSAPNAAVPNDAGGAVLGGHLTDSANAPVAGATVTLTTYPIVGTAPSDTPDGSFQTQTDVNGVYSFPGLDSAHFFTVQYLKDGYAAQAWPDSGLFYMPGYVGLDEDEIFTDLDAVLYRPATVSGVITFAGLPTRPFADGDVYVDVMLKDPSTNTWVYTGYGSVVAANGSYSIGGLPPDTYRFQTSSYDRRGLSTVTTAPLTLAEGAATTVAPRLRPFLRDVTGDRESDLMARTSTGQLMVYQGTGTGGFFSPYVHGTGWSKMTAVINAGDFNGDGSADVIARDAAGALWLYKGNGAGGWRGAAVKIGTGWKPMTAIFSPGDFNGDGKVDLVARTAAGDLMLYKGNGAGGWLGAVKIGSGWKSFTAVLAAGDMNEDSFLDVVARDSTGALWLYPGNGSGGWKPRVKIGAGWTSMTAIIGLGDFDGDWAPDLIARDATGNLWLYPGTGSGTLAAKHRIGVGWKSLLITN